MLDGVIYLSSSAWIVGNEVRYPGNYSYYYGIQGFGDLVRILANRVSVSGGYGGIYSPSAYAVIQGNIVETTDGGTASDGILASGSGYATIVNNVVSGSFHYGIYASPNVARVSGNIVTDVSITPIYTPSPVADISNNLCWNNTGDCPAGNGNLNADPRFVERVDYRLAPNSPAIDAGPADYEFADLDRSRNDMGAHGGPYSIGQYDPQRDPANLSPYVYPLINSAAGGVLEVQALGVARLR